MKRVLSLISVCLVSFLFSQKAYSKINSSKVNQERQKVAKDFAQLFIDKCEKENYGSFEPFILSKRIEFKNNELQKTCEALVKKYGKMKLSEINSVYESVYLKNSDPMELFIFDFSTEKLPQVKYANVWVYHDKNIISGIYFSTEKPLKRKKDKQNKPIVKDTTNSKQKS